MGLKQPTCILRKGLLSQQNLHQRTFIHDEKMTKKKFPVLKMSDPNRAIFFPV
jgi:hypothetical protein